MKIVYRGRYAVCLFRRAINAGSSGSDFPLFSAHLECNPRSVVIWRACDIELNIFPYSEVRVV